MIQCNGCECWQHNICVGIGEVYNGDWYCKDCRKIRYRAAAKNKGRVIISESEHDDLE